MRSLVSGLVLVSLAGSAFAQFAAISQPPMRVLGGRGMMMEEGEISDEMYDDGMVMSQGGRAEGEDQPPVFKTPLGKYLQRQDFTRTPEAVLKARAKLAIDAREATLKPVEDPAKAPANVPAGTPAGERSASDGAPRAPEEATPSPVLPEPIPDAPGNARAIAGIMADTPVNMGDDPEGGVNEFGPGMQPGMQRGMTPGGKPNPAARPPTAQEKKAGDRLRLCFVAGDWPAVGAFLKSEAGEDGEALFAHLVNMLQRDTAMVPGEVLAFSECAPKELADKHTTKLAGVLKNCIRRGADPANVSLMITRGTTHFGGSSPAGRARAARFLMAADLPVEAQPFLDPLEQAQAEKNAALINLHAMYFQGSAARKKDPLERKEAIRRSWELCLEVLNISEAKTADRSAALERAISFMDDVAPETVDGWLKGLFENAPDLAWTAIEKANQRARMARGQGRQPDDRVKGLLAIKRIGKALLDGAGENLPLYRTALDMMSMTILEEAEDTKRRRQDERFRFIPPEQLGEALPTAAWLRAGDPGLAAKLELQAASVSGGAGDVSGVLDMIRPLVATDKERAGKIAEAVVAAWPSYVKPGQQGNEGYDPYGGMYSSRRYYGGGYYGGYGGYGGYDGSIPLTRARQERYLEQLGTLLAEFQALGLPAAPTPLVVAAFAASHSDAEVYQTEAITAVFGPPAKIAPEVGIELADTMRKRLGGLWRKPQTQQENGAKRNDKQIAAEVLRGYGQAVELAEQAAATDTTNWRATTLLADLSFDKAEFLYGQKADLATYSGLRETAFSGYAKAAEQYVAALQAGKVQPTARVYFQWFSSSLGASDLGVLTRQDQPNETQIDRVVAAIRQMPGAEQTRHVGLFAKDVANALNTLAPELKVRFLTNAGRIVGDHPDGAAARKQLAYYLDLKKEVELAFTIDGPTQIGHTEPFGAVLSVWATRAVGRDSGGFSKYLMNQQWHPQTGQPIDYKDDLEKKLREILAERFEVASISFCKPGLTPLGLARPGWEQHPLAYLLLKPKDASVDKVPALQLDMDFSDGRGSVILPVTSSVTLVDARSAAAPRTVEKFEIEQTLDDRKPVKTATVGPAAPVLKLEVRAKGRGLIPALSSVLDLGAMKGFEVVKTDDHGTNIAEVDTSGEGVAVIAERSWTLDLAPLPGRAPAEFTFPTLKIKAEKSALKRYADADIVDAGPTVAVALPSKTPVWQLAAAVGLAVVILGGVVTALLRKRRGGPAVAAPRFVVPTMVTPVNAIAVLKRIANVPEVSLPEGDRVRLITQIADLEERYFAPSPANVPAQGELVTIVQTWVGKAERALQN